MLKYPKFFIIILDSTKIQLVWIKITTFFKQHALIKL